MSRPAKSHFDWADAALALKEWKVMCLAPKDGTFVRLRFRPGVGRELREAVGQWQAHEEMLAGGAWFDREGNYITPGPYMWAPEHGRYS